MFAAITQCHHATTSARFVISPCNTKCVHVVMYNEHEHKVVHAPELYDGSADLLVGETLVQLDVSVCYNLIHENTKRPHV